MIFALLIGASLLFVAAFGLAALIYGVSAHLEADDPHPAAPRARPTYGVSGHLEISDLHLRGGPARRLPGVADDFVDADAWSPRGAQGADRPVDTTDRRPIALRRPAPGVARRREADDQELVGVLARW